MVVVYLICINNLEETMKWSKETYKMLQKNRALQKRLQKSKTAEMQPTQFSPIPFTTVCPPRETPRPASLGTDNGVALKKDTQYYTGNNIKGIGTLHKSNAVPVFTDDEAKDQATMRR